MKNWFFLNRVIMNRRGNSVNSGIELAVLVHSCFTKPNLAGSNQTFSLASKAADFFVFQFLIKKCLFHQK